MEPTLSNFSDASTDTIPAPNETPEVKNFINLMRRGEFHGSYAISAESIDLFKSIIENHEWETAQDLIDLISGQAKVFGYYMKDESITPNVARRILRIIRDEYHTAQKISLDDGQGSLSLHKLITQGSDALNYRQIVPNLKELLLDNLTEIETELETSDETMAAQAPEHIHNSEVIFTLGYSKSVENFLKRAAKTRKFEVIVAQSGAECEGHKLAANLAKAKIETTIVPDSAIFAMMSRVNKVIIGTHTVLANGGLRANVGAHSLALAAKHFSVPVVVLVPMFKLTPVHVSYFELDYLYKLGGAWGCIPYDSLAQPFTICYNPLLDYVPPELVTLFITNTGGNAPMYVYRLLTELYHPDDYELKLFED